MKDLTFHILGFLLCSMIFSCVPCEEEADLVIPEFIYGTVQVAQETGYTVIGLQEYPFGSPVFLSNSKNEFYSVKRINPFTGIVVTFYWNVNSPPPFFFGAPPPIHPLQLGEEITVHRCVFNQEMPDFNCLFKSASPSKTEMRTRIRIANGEVVEMNPVSSNTPSIPAGEYRVTSFPIKVGYQGNYQLTFKANSDGSIVERDTSNNTYIERSTNNLATK